MGLGGEVQGGGTGGKRAKRTESKRVHGKTQDRNRAGDVELLCNLEHSRRVDGGAERAMLS